MVSIKHKHYSQKAAFLKAVFCISVLSARHTNGEVITMAKQGMKRPERTHTQPKNELMPVPEIQGKAKSTKEKAKPITEK